MHFVGGCGGPDLTYWLGKPVRLEVSLEGDAMLYAVGFAPRQVPTADYLLLTANCLLLTTYDLRRTMYDLLCTFVSAAGAHGRLLDVNNSWSLHSAPQLSRIIELRKLG